MFRKQMLKEIGLGHYHVDREIQKYLTLCCPRMSEIVTTVFAEVTIEVELNLNSRVV